jgi:hypothetical protein
MCRLQPLFSNSPSPGCRRFATAPRSATVMRTLGGKCVMSAIQAGNRQFVSGMRSIVPPPAAKCRGASMCVPLCE